MFADIDVMVAKLCNLRLFSATIACFVDCARTSSRAISPSHVLLDRMPALCQIVAFCPSSAQLLIETDRAEIAP